jgi:hypothetical protein
LSIDKYFRKDDTNTKKRAIALWQSARAEASLSVFLLARCATAGNLLLTSLVSDRFYVGQLLANLCGYLLAGARCARPRASIYADRQWISTDLDIGYLESFDVV